MITSGYSLFGFDLFGLGRRSAEGTEEGKLENHAAETAADEDQDRLSEREVSESFFWGMYPVY